MRIGFTGTQKGMVDLQKKFIPEILRLKNCSEFVFGDCVGSDREAADIAVDEGVSIFTVYPPDKSAKRAYWPTGEYAKINAITKIQAGTWYKFEYRNKVIQVRWLPPDTYLSRNKHIVDSVEWMIAAPKEHTHTVRSGTWMTIRYCWKIKREITIIPPIVRDDSNE